jgi:ubiquinone/menaquinone biosynthesis C-methylase UbiE
VAENGDVAGYYSGGKLLDRLNAALRDDGVDPDRPSVESLAPYDQFHGRGIEATEEIAAMLRVAPTDHLLDVGSGIGGPARYMAQRFGCRVTGIDLTAEFCEVARHLTQLLGLHARVRFQLGDALAMPFDAGGFDGAYSMNVSMNIADKGALYREIHRMLRPGGWLVLSELAKGPGPELDYPVPWAASAETSFLATIDETRTGLAQAGFEVLELHDNTEKVTAYGARSRAAVASGAKPPHRAVQLIHREVAKQAMANSSRGVAEGRLVPIEVLARKAR